MPRHDVIAIGTSAGGVEALMAVAARIPAGFPGTIFVVVHMYPRSRSFLPEILSRAGKLPAVAAEDGLPISPGTIYVAVPDRHLIVERGHMHLSTGPKEQHQRPSINLTFRSAALAYGERVVGVVLTGEMDDGTGGLWDIKRRGGLAVVQNPEGAMFPSMPLSALREIEADYTVNLAEIGALLCRLATEGHVGPAKKETGKEDMQPILTDITCPDCRGTIWEVPRANGSEYRCRVGHTFSPKTMFAEHFVAQEKALYAAVVALEEGASLANRLSGQFDVETASRMQAEARERQDQADAIRKILRERSSFSIE